MAIAVHAGRRHVTHRPLWMRQRSAGPSAALPLVIVMVLTIAITVLVLPSQIAEVSLPRLPSFQPAAPTRPVDGATPISSMSVSTSAVPSTAASAAPDAESADAPSALATPSDLDVGARARVANTDNLGVVFYAAPRDNARQPAGLLEGTLVTIVERSGDDWTRVQTDSKKSGWVHSEFLAPAE